jgi:hypothetical protein
MPKRFNSQKSNIARKFNSIMPGINEAWASSVLGIPENTSTGPDLTNENVFIEVKFSLYPNQKNYIKWTILGHQLDYQKQDKDKLGFWGLGTYSLKKPVCEIDLILDDLEKLVEKRELYIVKWDWMSQFKKYHNNGQTKLSMWDHYLLHAKFNKLPEKTKTIKVKKGLIHLTNNLDLSYFPNLKKS